MLLAEHEGAAATPVRPAPLPAPKAPSAFGLFAVAVALIGSGLLGWLAWAYYVYTPWTRDGVVRAYTAQIAPEVPGRVTDVLVSDNQIVHKGDVLFRIDDRDFRIAVERAQAALDRAQAQMTNARAEAMRREKLSDLAVTAEERETYESNAQAAQATYQGAIVDLANAKLNLDRTEVRSPVNGYVTNLLLQAGTYAVVGQPAMTLINADSYWVTGYFEETQLTQIRVGTSANIVLMGYGGTTIHGRVESLGYGITDPNAAPGVAGLPAVNPVFTWVRLAQRIPIRIEVKQWPHDLHIAAGMTATVRVLDEDAETGSSSKP
ncbi:HlyD family secretion protein [Methylobacterium sp. ID0610]|uniref:HlyD family secretion protein n=1 Tax=Methylobacterium carpenticola TaxID=3344827 RepID=UPI00369CBEBA